MKKLYVMAAALLAFASCSNEELTNGNAAQDGVVRATFEQGTPVSRLAIGEENALTWSTGDAFALFGNGTSAQFTLQSGAGEATATFTGTAPETITGAAFPYTSENSLSLSDNTLTMTLLSTLDQTTAGVCNLPMWAATTSTDNISFKHLAGVLKVNYANLPEGYNTLTVTASSPIAGEFTADTSADEPVLTAGTSATNTVTVTFTATTASENNPTLYLPLPVGTYESISVSVGNDTESSSLITYTNKTVERAKVYSISAEYTSSDATVPSAVSTALESVTGSTASLALTGTIDATAADAGDIDIPTALNSVSLDFNNVPTTSSDAPLTINSDADATSTDASKSLNIDMPEATSTDAGVHLELNTPTTTATLNSGTYAEVTATTATETLIIGKGAKVTKAIIKGGHVRVHGTLSGIERGSDYEGIIYVIKDDDEATVPETISDENIKVVSSAEYELRKAVEEGGTVTLSADMTLTEWIVIEKDLVLDLGGHTLTFNTANELGIKNAATATSTIKNGKIVSNGVGVQNNGTLTINCDIEAESSAINDVYDGNLTIEDGNYKSTSTENSLIAINGWGTGKPVVTVNGGTFESPFTNLSFNNDATGTVNAGTFKCTGQWHNIYAGGGCTVRYNKSKCSFTVTTGASLFVLDSEEDSITEIEE